MFTWTLFYLACKAKLQHSPTQFYISAEFIFHPCAPMETRDILTLIGWPVSCLLSVIGGGFLIPRLTRKRKALSWVVISEVVLIPADLQKSLSVPISIQIGGVSPKSLTLVTICITNSGDEVLEDLSVSLAGNVSLKMQYIKPAAKLGEFQKHVQGTVQSNRSTLHFDFLNPRKSVVMELLLTDYEEGSLFLDCAAPGVDVRRIEPKRSSYLIRMSLLGFAGVDYLSASSVLGSIRVNFRRDER